MGGPGSGRKVSDDRKEVVEKAYTIDLRLLMDEGLLKSNHSQGKIQWHSNAFINFDLIERQNDTYHLTLRYERKLNGVKHQPDYSILIHPIHSKFAKIGYVFKCPLFNNEMQCTRNATKLYLPKNSLYFGCRHCLELTYRVCQENHTCDANELKNEAETQRMDMTGHLKLNNSIVILNRY